jgi:hypothetical protein
MIPTPSYGGVGEQWWYYTHAFLSLQWSSEQDDMPLEDVSAVIQGCLARVFEDLMFPSMVADMETAVSVGNNARHLMTTLAVDEGDDFDDGKTVLNWDDFTVVGSLFPLSLTPT